MFRLFCLIIGYGLGCLQSAYFVGKFFGHIDIREYGSGNAGFTNTSRVLGRKLGAIVFIFDLFKVILAYYICTMLFKGSGTFVDGSSHLPGIYAGVGAVLGHNFPFYINFKGGKGIACTLGLMLCIDWKIALITYAVGIVVVLATKYISASSLSMALVYPIVMVIMRNIESIKPEEIILMFVLCVLAYYKHKANIQRLMNGTESKVGTRSKERAVK